MQKLYPLFLILLIPAMLQAQVTIRASGTQVKAADGFNIMSYELFSGHSKINENPRAVFFYIQGSEFESVTQKVHFMASAVILGCRTFMSEKRGVGPETVDTAVCYRYDDKTTRTNDNLAVISYYLQQIPDKIPVVLVGGSEGGDIAAAIVEKCSRINYLILIGSGGGWSQETEFRYFVSKQPGYLGMNTVNELDQKLTEIAIAPNDSLLWAGHPYRRWKSYLADSSLLHLKKIEIPILLLHGSADENVPVESSRSLAKAFKELNKNNLTYIEYQHLDHSLNNVVNKKSYYPHMEIDIIEWLNKYGIVNDNEKEMFTSRVKSSHKDIF